MCVDSGLSGVETRPASSFALSTSIRGPVAPTTLLEIEEEKTHRARQHHPEKYAQQETHNHNSLDFIYIDTRFARMRRVAAATRTSYGPRQPPRIVVVGSSLGLSSKSSSERPNFEAPLAPNPLQKRHNKVSKTLVEVSIKNTAATGRIRKAECSELRLEAGLASARPHHAWCGAVELDQYHVLEHLPPPVSLRQKIRFARRYTKNLFFHDPFHSRYGARPGLVSCP